MGLNKTYFETKGRDVTFPIPSEPSYVPPVVPEPGTPVPSIVPNIPRPTFTSNLTLDLYYNSSDNRKLNKTLSNKKSINISLKETTDLLNPMLLIESDTDLTRYNYGHINELGRYYYINAKRLDNNKMYELYMKQDHLMTYKNSILRLVCIIDKQEELYNDLLDDGSYISQVDDYTNRYYFLSNGVAKGFNTNPTNILICAGGDASLFAGGSITVNNPSHITVTPTQPYVEDGDYLYFFVNADAGYAIDSITVSDGETTTDITSTLDPYGQYFYYCSSSANLTVTVTEKSV